MSVNLNSPTLTSLQPQIEQAVQQPAAQRLNQVPSGVFDLTQAIESLGIYQVELELQNEELQQAQRASEISNSRYQMMFECLPIPAYIVDEKLRVLNDNALAREWLMSNAHDALYKARLMQALLRADRLRLLQVLSKATCAKVEIVRGVQLTDDAKCVRQVDMHVMRLPFDFHADPRYTVMLLDRSADAALELHRKEFREAIEQSNHELHRCVQFLNQTVALAKIGGWEYDPSTQKLSLTQEAQRLLKIAPQHTTSLQDLANILALPGRPILSRAIQTCLAQGTAFNLELPVQGETNHQGLVRIQGLAQVNHGKTKRLYGTLQWMQSCFDPQAKPNNALKEQATMLKEVHLGVTNHLQLVSSLLRQEAKFSTSNQVTRVLRDVQGRIHALLHLHEKLYRSGSLDLVDLGPYLEVLAHTMFEIYSVYNKPYRLRVETQSIWASVEQAVSCGMLLSELMSQCLKCQLAHINSEICVQLKPAKSDKDVKQGAQEQQWQLRVSNTGTGAHEDTEVFEPQSWSGQLIDNLSRQLGGHLMMEQERGVAFNVVFTLQKHQQLMLVS